MYKTNERKSAITSCAVMLLSTGESPEVHTPCHHPLTSLSMGLVVSNSERSTQEEVAFLFPQWCSKAVHHVRFLNFPIWPTSAGERGQEHRGYRRSWDQGPQQVNSENDVNIEPSVNS